MDNVIAYFNGEKLQCSVGAIVSIIVIAISIVFLFQQKPFLKGLSYAAIPLSVLLLSVCIGVVFRTAKDIERVSIFRKETPERIQTDEIPRMEKVMKSFNIIKKVEIVVFIMGLVLAVLFWRNELVRGVAIGLVIMGASLYVFDHIAEYRGEKYIQFLKSL